MSTCDVMMLCTKCGGEDGRCRCTKDARELFELYLKALEKLVGTFGANAEFAMREALVAKKVWDERGK